MYIFVVFLTPEYEYSYSKDKLFFNNKFWRSVFRPFITFFLFSEIPVGSCIVVFQIIQRIQ